MPPALAESVLFAFVVLAGLAVGSLGLLLIGRLLGREWLTPLDDELEPAALTLPWLALLAVPLAFAAEVLYGKAAAGAPPSAALEAWYTPDALVARAAVYLVAWSGLAFVVAGRDGDVRTSAIGLALLLPTASLAGFDWVLGRGPFWWSGLFGFAFALSLLAPALALAFLANLVQRERMARLHDRSLRSALLTLALATAGAWFLQYLAAWFGNLPPAVRWYEARFVDGRGLPFAAATVLLATAVVLLLQPRRGTAVVAIAAALVLAQHVLHAFWLLRPAGTPAVQLLDLGALGVGVLLWILPYAWLVRRHERRSAQSGRPGSS